VLICKVIWRVGGAKRKLLVYTKPGVELALARLYAFWLATSGASGV